MFICAPQVKPINSPKYTLHSSEHWPGWVSTILIPPETFRLSACVGQTIHLKNNCSLRHHGADLQTGLKGEFGIFFSKKHSDHKLYMIKSRSTGSSVRPVEIKYSGTMSSAYNSSFYIRYVLDLDMICCKRGILGKTLMYFHWSQCRLLPKAFTKHLFWPYRVGGKCYYSWPWPLVLLTNTCHKRLRPQRSFIC